MTAWWARSSSEEGREKVSVSEGENWKREEREEEEEAAALRRSWGRGEAVRREGRAALKEEEDAVILGELEGMVGHDVVLVVRGDEKRFKTRKPAKNWRSVIGPATGLAWISNRASQHS